MQSRLTLCFLLLWRFRVGGEKEMQVCESEWCAGGLHLIRTSLRSLMAAKGQKVMWWRSKDWILLSPILSGSFSHQTFFYFSASFPVVVLCCMLPFALFYTISPDLVSLFPKCLHCFPRTQWSSSERWHRGMICQGWCDPTIHQAKSRDSWGTGSLFG